jgi:hypothetical protein
VIHQALPTHPLAAILARGAAGNGTLLRQNQSFGRSEVAGVACHLVEGQLFELSSVRLDEDASQLGSKTVSEDKDMTKKITYRSFLFIHCWVQQDSRADAPCESEQKFFIHLMLLIAWYYRIVLGEKPHSQARRDRSWSRPASLSSLRRRSKARLRHEAAPSGARDQLHQLEPATSTLTSGLNR